MTLEQLIGAKVCLTGNSNQVREAVRQAIAYAARYRSPHAPREGNRQ